MISAVAPDPSTVKLPVPVIAPFTMKSPVPPELFGSKSTVTALLLFHAAATVTSPSFVVVSPRTTEETED